MKKIIIAITVLTFASCSLDGLNKNIKDPAKSSGESLFTSAEKTLVDQMLTPSVNFNNTLLWVQYWQETTYTDESNYDQTTRPIPDRHYSRLYKDVLKDLDEAKKIITATTYLTPALKEVKANKLAVTEILTIYTFAINVETFGNIPYTEALDINNVTPKYDDGLTIYKDLIKRLTTVISKLDVSKGSFAGADRIYNGDMKKWKNFAASLKLRMGILLSDVDTPFAKKIVEEAVASGIFTSNNDNAKYKYLSAAPNTNPVHTELKLSGRDDFVAGKTIIDMMNTLKDPRIAFYFKPTKDGTYKGGVIGKTSNFKTFSNVADKVQAADASRDILDYAEVQFLLAEATARGFTVGGTAKEHYDAGIIASFEYWGGTAEQAKTYMAQSSVNYVTALAASKATAPWKEVIGTQKWLALYNRGLEAWTSIRLLDFPKLVTPTQPVSGFPTRYTYPIEEQTNNSTNWKAAATAIGGDLPETKLFWDKN